MKVCFFGMGSIGTRHAMNLRALLERRGKRAEIHALRSSGGTSNAVDRCFSCWKELESPYDAIFITNPTSLHYETLLRAESLGKSFFVEKPLFLTSAVTADALTPFVERTTHVACPLRFHPVVEYLKERMPERVLAARLLCSSYLPEWRKRRDYRTVYSARREQGGGVALDLIHELDYARHLFGDPREVIRVVGKFSRLEIDSDDAAAYILTYANKLVEVHLDYFGRKARRELELICEEESYLCDLLANNVTALTSGETTTFPQANIHEQEMAYFLNLLEHGERSFNPLENALETLRIAEGGRAQ